MEAILLIDGRLTRTQSVADVREAHLKNLTLWAEIGPRSEEAAVLLLDTFALHPLVVEDIFSDNSSPKIDAFDAYLYIVVHALRPSAEPNRVEFEVLDVVIGKTFVLTQHRDGLGTDRMRGRVEAKPQLLRQGPAWVAHAFLDGIIDRYLPVMTALAKRIDDAEIHVLAGPKEEVDLLPKLVNAKRAVQAIRRMAHHQLDLLQNLAGTSYPLIPADARPYFRDVHEHFSRVTEEAERCTDVITNVIDAHLSVQSNRMNETVKRLTLISTVMLPLNFIAGFYGMNFRNVPELDWRYGRIAVIVLMFVVTGAVWSYFKKKRWV